MTTTTIPTITWYLIFPIVSWERISIKTKQRIFPSTHFSLKERHLTYSTFWNKKIDFTILILQRITVATSPGCQPVIKIITHPPSLAKIILCQDWRRHNWWQYWQWRHSRRNGLVERNPTMPWSGGAFRFTKNTLLKPMRVDWCNNTSTPSITSKADHAHNAATMPTLLALFSWPNPLPHLTPLMNQHIRDD